MSVSKFPWGPALPAQRCLSCQLMTPPTWASRLLSSFVISRVGGQGHSIVTLALLSWVPLSPRCCIWGTEKAGWSPPLSAVCLSPGQSTSFKDSLLTEICVMGPGRCPAAAAKSLQSCPTLCDLIGGSPLGSCVPGILQTRILEWVALSFSNA